MISLLRNDLFGAKPFSRRTLRSPIRITTILDLLKFVWTLQDLEPIATPRGTAGFGAWAAS